MTNEHKFQPGWRMVKFGDVVRQVADRVDPKNSGLERYIAGEHMDTDNLLIRRWGEIGDDYLGPAFHMRFKPGHVLYGSRQTYLRKVAVPDFEGICANTTFVLESKDPSVLLPVLLPFIMQTEAFHNHSIKHSKGSVNPYVNFSDIAWYEFVLPPLQEQLRIYTILRAIESTLQCIGSLENTLEDLRKSYIIATFSKLFTNKRTKIVKVSDAGESQMGRQRAPKYAKGILPRPYLRAANVFDGYIDFSDVKTMDFNDDDFMKFHLEPGDVLIVEGGSIGQSAIYTGEISNACFQNTLLRFRPYAVSSAYSHYYFQYCLYTGKFMRMAKSTAYSSDVDQ